MVVFQRMQTVLWNCKCLIRRRFLNEWIHLFFVCVVLRIILISIIWITKKNYCMEVGCEQSS